MRRKPPFGGRFKRTAQTNPEGLQEVMGKILDSLERAGMLPSTDVEQHLEEAGEGRLIKRGPSIKREAES